MRITKNTANKIEAEVMVVLFRLRQRLRHAITLKISIDFILMSSVTYGITGARRASTGFTRVALRAG